MPLHHLSPRQSDVFPGTCPSGAKWYACPETSQSHFVGCCTSDPCSTGCSQGAIKPATFDTKLNMTAYPDASCGTASDFFKCNFDAKTFWGCCKTDPCKQGVVCPSGDLVPAFMERKEQFIAYAGAPPKDANKEQTTSNKLATIGGAVGAVLGFTALLTIIIFFICRRRRRNKRPTIENEASETTPMAAKDSYSPNTDIFSPYASPNPNSYPPSPALRPYTFEAQSQTVQELPAAFSSSLKPSNARYSELPAYASSARGSLAPGFVFELPAEPSRKSVAPSELPVETEPEQPEPESRSETKPETKPESEETSAQWRSLESR